MLAVEVAISS